MGYFTSRVCCFQNQSNCTFLLYSSNSTKTKFTIIFGKTRKPYSFDIEYSALRSIHDKRTGFLFHITFEIRCHTVRVHLKLSTYTQQPQPTTWEWWQNRQICQKILKITPKLCQSVFNTALSQDGGEDRYETPCILVAFNFNMCSYACSGLLYK